MGNNVAGEHWDQVVASSYVTYTKTHTKDVKEIDNALDKILKLRPVSYKDRRNKNGLLPDEVEAVIPEAVISEDVDIDPETGEVQIRETEKGMVYDQLIPVLIGSIQEQQEIIKELKMKVSEINHLKAEINEIKKLLNK